MKMRFTRIQKLLLLSLSFGLFLFSNPFFANSTSLVDDNHGCSNGSLRIELNTPDTVVHTIRTAYNSVMPEAFSGKWNKAGISLVLTSSNVNPNVPGTYKECYTATDGDGLSVSCCRTVIVKEEQSSSVSEINNNAVSVFPNPVDDGKFTVRFTESFASNHVTIRLTDVTGRIVYETNASSTEDLVVDVSALNLSKGIYALQIQSSDRTAVKSLVFK
ncbi:MAG: T9SS type A sorting domain-containing protein [Bacteroidetes bacterium]|nr:T9SS type A sorting domain-containing protein [Bacteroidota bacterium]